MESNAQKLSIFEKIGYGLGDTASNLFFQIFIIFLLYFYTDVFGITAAQLGLMLLVTRFWDAVNDPIMGMLADRTVSRWGKFRPYLLFGAVPFGILGVLMFTTPQFSPTGKLIYAYVTYIAMTMIYTAVNVPYAALMGVISPDSMERTVVSSFRFVLAFVGMFIVQYALLRLVKLFGGGNEQLGWQLAAAALAGLAVVLFLITFFTTRERVQPIGQQRNKLADDLKDLLTNKPWLLIGSATVFQLMFIVIRSSSIMYYFEYYLGNKELSFFGKTKVYSFEDIVSAYLLTGTVFTILGAVLTKWIARAFGKSQTYSGGLAIAGIASALVFVLGPDDIVLLFVLQFITSFAIGPVSVLQWAIYTDTADYSEWKTNRRATALIMAASLFALKMGVALGGTAQAWIMAAYGYVANQPQTPQALTGIRMVMSVYAGIFALLGAAVMLFYPLNNQRMKTIESQLNERRQKNSAGN
ncbi:MAG TPA: MFS transporter [Anaerohalosphaeraceae bacterium]|nr:MFS transporter [Phycisphaerae bacterium]HOK95004.1 MFS transporter [Anaerohalosphaeraceae bacterium]HOL30416.1 MFS transporter [Anaerohalosphaeraceae bacterium]HOM75688.1 MFS transporter [Anaerohalosphaeraceae bacterium]HPC64184.1 MFS transporter [Anaerohalosphaeraceae bacterium]